MMSLPIISAFAFLAILLVGVYYALKQEVILWI
jgi:NADH:ubiquinone oxidoreductase subunit 3 (subunit A)